MKRNFLLAALLTIGAMGVAASEASAWGERLHLLLHPWNYSKSVNIHISRPYNAFTPFTSGISRSVGVGGGFGGGDCCCFPGFGFGGGGFGACGCPSGPPMPPPGPCAAMPGMMNPMLAQMQMPTMNYYNPYGVQPVGFYPGMVPGGQMGYYPVMPQANPYMGYGYGNGYGN